MQTTNDPGGAPSAAANAADLVRTYREIRERVASRVVGLDDAVARLSLIGALHVAGELKRGPRVLLLGPSGAGKNTLASALEYALQPWHLPWVCTPVLAMTAVGWSGAPTINLLVQAALGDRPHDPRAVIVIDELHHARVIPGLHGVTAAHRADLLTGLMEVAGGGIIRLGEGMAEYSCSRALVITMGAFTDLVDLSRPVSMHDLVRVGIPLELATRIAEEIVVLPAPGERETKEILRAWPALTSLIAICGQMGFSVRIPEESYGRAARALHLGGTRATLRTAGGWFVSALRHALIAGLEVGEPGELILAPDSLPIPPGSMAQEDPPDTGPAWDATITLRPR